MARQNFSHALTDSRAEIDGRLRTLADISVVRGNSSSGIVFEADAHKLHLRPSCWQASDTVSVWHPQ